MSISKPFAVADRFAPFGTTIFTEMTALANTHQAVNLSQGFPDFDGPQIGKDAAIEAIKNGRNQYAPMIGVPELRQAIARWAQRVNGIDVDPDTEITVASGCTEAIAACLLGLVNPGEEVVVFEPYYDSYRACLAMAGAQAKFVTLHPDASAPSGFAYKLDELKAAFSSKTKAVLVNTPHNPTGVVFSQAQLQEIADLCIEHDVIALSDEVYERLVYAGATHCSIATLPRMRERTVVLSSSGKSFSLTGWKVGWAIAPPSLSEAIRSAHQFLTFSVPTPLQYGVAKLLDSGEDEIQKLVEHYTHTRSLLGEALAQLGFGITMPEGSYFLMAQHEAVSDRLGIASDVEMCRWLPTNAGVAAIPPSAFYHDPEFTSPYIRFAYCKQTKTIDEAIRRLRKALS